MTTLSRTLVYEGPLSGARALVQMLEEQGVGVAYDPPLHTRSIIGRPDGMVTIYYLCTAPDEAISAAIIQFENSDHATVGSVALVPSGNGAQNGNDLSPDQSAK